MMNNTKNELFQSMQILRDSGTMFQYMENEEFNGRTIKLKGQELINFASCSYMGLETHPKLKDSSIEATMLHGTQTPSSRAALSSNLYTQLESLLKNIFPGYQVVTQTVTLGHFSVLPLFITNEDAIVLDAYVHNSVRMASQVCKANGTPVYICRHNDIDYLKYLVYRLKKDGVKKIWYCADGVYSIHGSFSNISDLWELLDQEPNLHAYVDDAHGSGWYGKNGCGYVLDKFGLHSQMIVATSFAKSFATCGGCLIAPDKETADIIRYTGQTMIFSGPLPPPILGALVGSVKLHMSKEFEQMQNELVEKIVYFREQCNELDIPIYTKDISPIQLLIIGDKLKTYKVLEELKKNGFFITAAIYPAVAHGEEGLRITLTRHIHKKDIDRLLSTLKDILSGMGVINTK